MTKSELNSRLNHLLHLIFKQKHRSTKAHTLTSVASRYVGSPQGSEREMTGNNIDDG